MKDVQLELPAPELELAMQELEPMEAPGFWTGFKDGVAISAAVVSAFSASVAVSVATT